MFIYTGQGRGSSIKTYFAHIVSRPHFSSWIKRKFMIQMGNGYKGRDEGGLMLVAAPSLKLCNNVANFTVYCYTVPLVPVLCQGTRGSHHVWRCLSFSLSLVCYWVEMLINISVVFFVPVPSCLVFTISNPHPLSTPDGSLVHMIFYSTVVLNNFMVFGAPPTNCRHFLGSKYVPFKNS